MKTKIRTYKKPRTYLRLGIGDIVKLEMVLMRHIRREFTRRNSNPKWARSLQRMDIRDALATLKKIKSTPLEYVD